MRSQTTLPNEVRHVCGFTLLETLFAISILGILLIMSVGSSSNYQRRVSINSNVHEILSLLERARTLSMVRYNSTTASVRFETNRYILFRGAAYVEGAPTNDVRQLVGFRFVNPSVFSNGQGGQTQNVQFAAMNGTTVNTGTIRLESVSDTAVFRDIIINALGTVSVQ